jgi:hypothetical protein
MSTTTASVATGKVLSSSVGSLQPQHFLCLGLKSSGNEARSLNGPITANQPAELAACSTTRPISAYRESFTTVFSETALAENIPASKRPT